MYLLYKTGSISDGQTYNLIFDIRLKLKVNFEIYIADRKATSCI